MRAIPYGTWARSTSSPRGSGLSVSRPPRAPTVAPPRSRPPPARRQALGLRATLSCRPAGRPPGPPRPAPPDSGSRPRASRRPRPSPVWQTASTDVPIRSKSRSAPRRTPTLANGDTVVSRVGAHVRPDGKGRVRSSSVGTHTVGGSPSGPVSRPRGVSGQTNAQPPNSTWTAGDSSDAAPHRPAATLTTPRSRTPSPPPDLRCRLARSPRSASRGPREVLYDGDRGTGATGPPVAYRWLNFCL